MCQSNCQSVGKHQSIDQENPLHTSQRRDVTASCVASLRWALRRGQRNALRPRTHRAEGRNARRVRCETGSRCRDSSLSFRHYSNCPDSLEDTETSKLKNRIPECQK